MALRKYNKAFYERQKDGSYRSAKVLLPYVLGLVRPLSVVDFGCGIGTWLQVCKDECGCRVIGVDGGAVMSAGLRISEAECISADLRKPLDLQQRFDLAISVEVAEHIPSRCADVFVDTLTRHAPVILFSAGIPHWGGRGHVNEQWQEYWIEKFSQRSYEVIDCLRARFWNDDRLEWWYKHASFLFVARSHLESYQQLLRLPDHPSMPWNIVHPACHLGVADPRRLSMRRVILALTTLPRRVLS